MRKKGKMEEMKALSCLVVVLLVMSAMPLSILASATEADVTQGEYSGGGKIPKIANVQIDLERDVAKNTIDNILSELEQHKWHATVFVTGEFASKHQDIIKGIEDRGHQIAVLGEEDLTALDYKAQLDSISKSFSEVRNAVNKPDQVVDFKLYEYKFNNDTLTALQDFGASSISGVFKFNGSYCRCWYAESVGKITFPYPITTEFTAIPISEVQVDSEEILLDDSYLFGKGATPEDYLDYLVKEV